MRYFLFFVMILFVVGCQSEYENPVSTTPEPEIYSLEDIPTGFAVLSESEEVAMAAPSANQDHVAVAYLHLRLVEFCRDFH